MIKIGQRGNTLILTEAPTEEQAAYLHSLGFKIELVIIPKPRQ